MSFIDHISKTPVLGDRVFISDDAHVSGDVQIGDDSSVWPMAVIRGDMHKTVIGARTSIQDGAVLHQTHRSDFNPEGYPCVVGNDVTIGHNVCLHGCTVGNEVLVGIGSVILDGAVVEDKVIIAAGSVVPPGKTLESGYMYMGSPIKQARKLNEKELEFFTYSSGNYLRLKDHYLSRSTG